MENRSPDRPSILIVDDEPGIRQLLSELLRDSYDCTQAGSAEIGLAEIEKQHFDLVISDIKMEGMSGIEFTSLIKDTSPDTVVMMISGAQSPDTPIEALRSGAFDYIRKPFDVDQVEMAVERAVKHAGLLRSKREYETGLEAMVTERTLKLNYLAYNDPLTGLRNRVYFEEEISALIKDTERPDLAVLFISLDRFRDLRDTLGHTAGDMLIIDVAKRLKAVCSDAIALARFEGEEFAVLLSGLNTDSVKIFINKVFDAFEKPLTTVDDQIAGSISIGISQSNDEAMDAPTLLRNAGTALSYVRSGGGNGFKFFTSDMSEAARTRLSLENDLRKGLEQGEFELYYQPKVALASRNVTGMEALIRWDRRGQGIISPGEFIPVAEATGIIVPLGEWVLRAACAQTKAWHERGFLLTVSVNLSPRQFRQDDLAPKILEIVHETGLDPKYLNLEVTESAIMSNAKVAVQVLHQLRTKGVKISIDDFGTGYSSLALLKDLPVDELKIDKSFIDELNANADNAAMVTAIVTLAHNLHLLVVAEGVETSEQVEFLRRTGCDEVQGYLFSKPLRADEFGEFVSTALA